MCQRALSRKYSITEQRALVDLEVLRANLAAIQVISAPAL